MGMLNIYLYTPRLEVRRALSLLLLHAFTVWCLGKE